MGALNVPLEELKSGSDILPTEKEMQIILYAQGKNDKAAHEAAKSLKAQGYENVVVYDDGLGAWAEKEYLIVTDDYVKELIEDESKKDSYLLINALPTVEFNKAHIPSLNCPLF